MITTERAAELLAEVGTGKHVLVVSRGDRQATWSRVVEVAEQIDSMPITIRRTNGRQSVKVRTCLLVVVSAREGGPRGREVDVVWADYVPDAAELEQLMLLVVGRGGELRFGV